MPEVVSQEDLVAYALGEGAWANEGEVRNMLHILEPVIRAAERERLLRAWQADGREIMFNADGDDLAPQARVAKWLRNGGAR